eukprot:3251382-Heterocapsa_arctica.AAC.1
MADKAEHVAAITHSTRSLHLASIFRHGLHPGGANGSRNATNFNAFLPNDPRNVVEGRTSSELDAVIVYKTTTPLEAKPMTISHNGVIACEEVINFSFIDYIYIRTPSGAAWLLYDRELLNSPIRAVGNITWDTKDVTYGQHVSARQAHAAYADIRESDWPCNTQHCPNCHIIMPAGYMVCDSCQRPFIFEDINVDVPMSCR